MKRNLLITLCLTLFFFVLACGVIAPMDEPEGDLSLRRGPAWACISPTPKPYGPTGPKRSPDCCCNKDCDTDPVTGETDCHCTDDTCYTCRFYEWEQEYAALGGPPFPSPTPFNWDGQEYVFGQAVKLEDGFFVEVNARAGDFDPNDPDRWQLSVLEITWRNDVRSSEGQPLTHRVNYTEKTRSLPTVFCQPISAVFLGYRQALAIMVRLRYRQPRRANRTP